MVVGPDAREGGVPIILRLRCMAPAAPCARRILDNGQQWADKDPEELRCSCSLPQFGHLRKIGKHVFQPVLSRMAERTANTATRSRIP